MAWSLADHRRIPPPVSDGSQFFRLGGDKRTRNALAGLGVTSMDTDALARFCPARTRCQLLTAGRLSLTLPPSSRLCRKGVACRLLFMACRDRQNLLAVRRSAPFSPAWRDGYSPATYLPAHRVRFCLARIAAALLARGGDLCGYGGR